MKNMFKSVPKHFFVGLAMGMTVVVVAVFLAFNQVGTITTTLDTSSAKVSAPSVKIPQYELIVHDGERINLSPGERETLTISVVEEGMGAGTGIIQNAEGAGNVFVDWKFVEDLTTNPDVFDFSFGQNIIAAGRNIDADVSVRSDARPGDSAVIELTGLQLSTGNFIGSAHVRIAVYIPNPGTYSFTWSLSPSSFSINQGESKVVSISANNQTDQTIQLIYPSEQGITFTPVSFSPGENVTKGFVITASGNAESGLRNISIRTSSEYANPQTRNLAVTIESQSSIREFHLSSSPSDKIEIKLNLRGVGSEKVFVLANTEGSDYAVSLDASIDLPIPFMDILEENGISVSSFTVSPQSGTIITKSDDTQEFIVRFNGGSPQKLLAALIGSVVAPPKLVIEGNGEGFSDIIEVPLCFSIISLSTCGNISGGSSGQAIQSVSTPTPSPTPKPTFWRRVRNVLFP